jgi:hypothetical protein
MFEDIVDENGMDLSSQGSKIKELVQLIKFFV